MPLALLFSTVLAIGFYILASYATAQYAVIAKQHDLLTALELAEAGVERGLQRASEATFPTGATTVNINENIGSGSFSVSIVQSAPSPNYTLTITGTGTGPRGSTRRVELKATKTAGSGIVTRNSWRILP